MRLRFRKNEKVHLGTDSVMWVRTAVEASLGTLPQIRVRTVPDDVISPVET